MELAVLIGASRLVSDGKSDSCLGPAIGGWPGGVFRKLVAVPERTPMPKYSDIPFLDRERTIEVAVLLYRAALGFDDQPY